MKIEPVSLWGDSKMQSWKLQTCEMQAEKIY